MKNQYSTLLFTGISYLYLILPVVVAGYFPQFIIPEKHSNVTYIIFYLPLLILLIVRIAHAKPILRSHLGWKKPDKSDLPFIPLLLLLSIGAGFLLPVSSSPPQQNSGQVVLLLLLSVELAVIEELFFRSWMITRLLEEGFPLIPTALSSIILFAILHQGLNAMIAALFAGTLYTLIFIKRRCIGILIITHILYNLLAMVWNIWIRV